MPGVLVGVLAILQRVRQMGHLVDQVLVRLKLVTLVDRLQLGLFFARLRDLVAELLDGTLKLGFLPGEVIHTLRNVHKVCNPFLLLLRLYI